MAPSATSVTETITQALPTLSLKSGGAEGNGRADKGVSNASPIPAASANVSATDDRRKRWWSETAKEGDEYPYAAYLPTFDAHLKLPPLTEFEHVDPGHKALDDPEPLAFLAGAEVENLTPQFGTEVTGVQLHKLDERGRQQLALYVAQRGVVVRG